MRCLETVADAPFRDCNVLTIFKKPIILYNYLIIWIYTHSLESLLNARKTIDKLISSKPSYLFWLQCVNASAVKHRLSDPTDFLSLYTVLRDQLIIVWDAYIKLEVSQQNITTGNQRDIFDFDYNFASQLRKNSDTVYTKMEKKTMV